jgi:hypothetical protein
LKLRKRTLLITIVGIFVIVLISLGMLRSQQVSEQNQLNEQLTLIQSRLGVIKLEQLSSRQAELEEQLRQATSQFEAVKTILSQPVGSITATSILFDIARAHGLEVTEVTSPGPTSDSLEGITCSVLSLTVKVEGNVPNLVSFVTRLNSYFTTGVVKSITITIPEKANGEKASTDIQLVVYTYQGG